MPDYCFHPSRHSQVRGGERAFTIEDLKNVVTYCDLREKMPFKGQHGGNVYKYYKTVDGQLLTAVVEIKKNDCWLITGYYGPKASTN